MTTIQDRIIKDFRKILEDESQSIYWTVESGKMNFEIPRIEQFLIQSIKEVEEETRKEVFDNFPKVIEPPEDIEKFKEKRQAFLAGQMNMLMRLNDLSLSITNKENKK